MRSKKQFIWASIAVLLVASFVLAACAKTAEAPAVEKPAGETVAALPQGQELANA